MTNETMHSNLEQRIITLGAQLRSARESMGMDRKEAASQLRLHEKVIVMMESGDFKTDLPLTFIRGYIRNYGKLLDIPDHDVKEAIEAMSPKPAQADIAPIPTPVVASGPVATATRSMPISINNFFMQFFTYLIIITIFGLVGIWWHTNNATSNSNTLVKPVNKPAVIQNNSANIPVPAYARSYAVNEAAATASSNTSPSPQASTTTVAPVANTASASVKPTVQTAPAKAPAPTPADLRRATTLPIQFMPTDYLLRLLINFLLFISILGISLRSYAHSNRKPMAGARGSKKSTRYKYKLNFKMPLQMATPARIFGVLALLSLAGITSTMWHKYSAGSGRTAIASSQTNEAARNEPGANLQLDASLEALAPSSNLDAAFAGALQTSAVQSMINQLNDYSKQAALTKQVLTDPTTELGQLTYKKKMHRHRRVYQEYYDTNDNTDPYNDNDTNT